MTADCNHAVRTMIAAGNKGAYLVDTIEHVYAEWSEAKPLTFPSEMIELWHRHENIRVHHTVKQTHGNDGRDSPERIPE